MRFAPALLIALVALPVPAMAFWDGNKLLATCGGEATKTERAICAGYVKGLWDMVELHKANDICVGSGVALEQLIAVLVKDVRDQPEFRDFPMSFLAEIAMERLWPCQRKG